MTQADEHRARFDAWLRGDIPPAEEATLFAAAAQDPALAGEAEACRRAVAGLRALPMDIAPETDLWPGIAEEMRARQRLARRRQRNRSLVGLAAALIAVVAGIGGIIGIGGVGGWLALPTPATPSSTAAQPPRYGLPVALAAYAETDQALAAIGDELRREIESRQEKLPPETRILVFENLRTIDRALAEIGAALREAPADPGLARTYIAYRERQIDVLRQANRMAARL